MPRDDYAREVVRLREENERLSAELADLRRRIVPPTRWPAGWRLSPAHARMLSALVAAALRPVTRDHLLIAATGVLHPDHDPNLVSVQVSKLRQRLAALGFPGAITSIRGVGYRLDELAGRALRAAAAAEEERLSCAS